MGYLERYLPGRDIEMEETESQKVPLVSMRSPERKRFAMTSRASF